MLNLSISQAITGADDDMSWEVRIDGEVIGFIQPRYVMVNGENGDFWTEESGEYQIAFETRGRGYGGLWAQAWADPFDAAAAAVECVGEAVGFNLMA